MAIRDYGKAIGAGGSVLFAGALAKIVIRIISAKWPTFVDADIADSIDVIFVGLVAYIGAYIPPPPTQTKGP